MKGGNVESDSVTLVPQVGARAMLHLGRSVPSGRTSAGCVTSQAPDPSRMRHLAIGDAMALEDTMLAAAAGGNRRFDWAIWETDKCLVAPASMRCRIDRTGGASKSAQAGWPVHYRRSGGGVTPQGPGVINLSIAYALPSGKKPSIERSYRCICAPIVKTLAEFGLAASMGPVTGSFCDGAHNVIVDGRKLAGTAQRWKSARRGDGAIAVLAHALILTAPSSSAMAAIDALHISSGIEHELRGDAHLSLAELEIQTACFISTLSRHLQMRPASVDVGAVRPTPASC